MRSLSEIKIETNDPKTYVICRICGEKRSLLNKKHFESHGVTREENKKIAA